MIDDGTLVQRLRRHSKIMARDKGKFVRFIDVATCTEAIDRIEALEADNARLRAALVRYEIGTALSPPAALRGDKA